jgi:hypothetical protein
MALYIGTGMVRKAPLGARSNLGNDIRGTLSRDGPMAPSHLGWP